MFLRGDDPLTHVMCFTHVGEDRTIIYNPLYSGIVTHVIDEHADFVAAKFKRAGYDKVVKLIYNKQIRNISHSLSNTVPGCVTFAKLLIGSKDWIFTPSQFYHWLLRKGGIEISIEDADAIVKQELMQAYG